MKKVLSVFLSSILITVVFYTTAFALGGGVGGHPKNPLDSERVNWFMYNLDAGESYNDILVISNKSKEPWVVDLYTADTIKSAGGGFALAAKNIKPIKMGAWIKLSTGNFLLEPGTAKEIPFTVTIGKDTNAGEEIAGAIMIEKSKPTGEADIIKNEGGVRIRMRTGIRVYNTTPGEVVRKLKFNTFKINREVIGEKGEIYKFLIDVTNKGTVSVNADFHMTIKDVITGEEIMNRKSTYLINRDADFTNNETFLASALPKIGYFKAELKVDLQLPDGSVETVGQDSMTFYVVPMREVAAAIAVIILLILYLIYRRIKYSAKGWITYKVQEGDDLVHLASQYKVSWKVVAHINHIGAPYLLTAGTEILLPPKKA